MRIRTLHIRALFLFSLLSACVVTSLSAQEYLKGSIVKDDLVLEKISYDRTLNNISKNVYQTIYKVIEKKKVLYTITVTHDRIKCIFFLSVKHKDAKSATGKTISYDKSISGLILSNTNNVDTNFNISDPYDYLISFSDTMREFAIVHKVKLEDGRDLVLDPLTKLRLNRHADLIRLMLKTNPKLLRQYLPQSAKSFNQILFETIDSFYSELHFFDSVVTAVDDQIDRDINDMFKTKKVYPDSKRYEGEKRRGESEGKGLFMSNRSYYDGTFSNGKFVSGIVRIYADAYQYTGGYDKDSLNGIGKIVYDNGNLFTGLFKNGKAQSGIATTSERTGEVYFGSYNQGMKTGYAEFRDAKGAIFYGIFLNGKVVKGYSKEIDPFGYYTYSKIDEGRKGPAELDEAEEFFTYISHLKNTLLEESPDKTNPE